MFIVYLATNGDVIGGKFRFMYADAAAPVEKKARTPEQIAIQKAGVLAGLRKAQDTHRKRVICLDTGESFSSITDAAASCGAHISSVSAAIYRKGKAGDLRFAFVNQ